MDCVDIAKDVSAMRTQKMFLHGIISHNTSVDESYQRWISDYGITHLLRQWDRDDYYIVVPATPKRWSHPDFGELVSIAYSGESMLVCQLSASKLGEPALLVSHGNGLQRMNQSFTHWICVQYRKHKARYGVRRWKYLLAGPKPFSPEECVIVNSRLQWSIKVKEAQEAAPAGRILVEIMNGSRHRLDWLTATTIEPKEWEGDSWFDVKDIAPGQTAVRSKWSNDGKISASELLLRVKPISGPEDRRYAKELKGLVREP